MLKTGKWSSFIAIFLGVLLLATACSASVTTANLSDITMAKSVDEKTNQPLEKTDVFTINTPVIYLTANVNNAPDGTVVKSEWVATDVAGVDKGYIIDSVSLDKDGMKNVVFNLSKPDNGWPEGKYAVKLFIDDKLSQTVDFSVAK